MPQTTTEWRANASEQELRDRATEMRAEWAELSKSDRESDNFVASKREFLNEMDDIDYHLTLTGLAAQRAAKHNAPDGALHAVTEYRSAGEELTAHEEFRAWCQQQAGRAHITGESPTVEVRALVQLGTDAGYLAPVGQPFLANVDRRRLFVRDLISVQQTGLGSVPYVREKNATANTTPQAADQPGAASGATGPASMMVAEGAVKPQAKIEFVPDRAPIEVIAINIPLTTQVLEDVPTVVGYVNGRLAYMLALEEEAQILNGDGTTPDLKGIFTYSDVQTQSATAGDRAITIANAIAKIEVVNGVADGVAMHPSDAWAMFTKRAAGGSGTFDAGTPFSDIPLNVWGLPVVRSTGVTAGQAYVGSWKLGATLFDRRQASVRVYEQHADYAVRNMVLLQGEERVGLAVFRPDWFVNATL